MNKETITLTLSKEQFRAVMCAMDNATHGDYPGDAWFEDAWNALNEAEAEADNS